MAEKGKGKEEKKNEKRGKEGIGRRGQEERKREWKAR